MTMSEHGRVNARDLLLTAGGLGFCRPAPGTWGSTPPAAIAFLMASLLGATWLIEGVMVALIIIFTVVCLRLGKYAEERFGRKDPSQVVADEVAGQAVALLVLPWRAVFGGADGALDTEALSVNIMIAACAFLTFRFFDIIKPPPANALQRLEGGLGIVIDDLLAGVYALIATQLIVRLALPGLW